MGRKKKKIEEPSGPAGAPDWVVTFTDMISLLVTFFILLLTFSSMDSYYTLQVDSFLEGKRGMHKAGGSSLVDVAEEDTLAASSVLRGANTPHTRPPDGLDQSIEEMGQRNNSAHQALDMNDVADGLLIEFNAAESFEPGSIQLSGPMQKSLRDIAKVLQHYPHQIVVEGFTDGAFQPDSNFASEDELSVARADAAAEYMIQNSKLSSEMIQLAGLGQREAVADNATATGRQLNRRIRLRVLSMDEYRAASLEALK